MNFESEGQLWVQQGSAHLRSLKLNCFPENPQRQGLEEQEHTEPQIS